MCTTRLAALTRAPPRPGAGPQLSPVDLSLSSRELARPHPPERVPAVRPATPASPEAALPSVLRGHAYQPIRSCTSNPSPVRKCLGHGGVAPHGTAPPIPPSFWLPLQTSARDRCCRGRAWELAGDAWRGRVHSRGSRSEARVVKKIRTELIKAIGEDWVAKCDLRAGMGGDKHLCRPLGRDWKLQVAPPQACP